MLLKKHRRINNKAQVSRTVILFSMLMFYTTVGFFYGLYGSTVQIYSEPDKYQTGYGTITTEDGNTTTWSNDEAEEKSGIRQLVSNVVIGYQEAPTFVNVLLLGLLIIFVGYLVLVSFLPTSNAGG